MTSAFLLADAELRRRIRGLDLESKVRLLTGDSVWTLPAEPRLGLRALTMSDGPQGVRGTGADPAETGLLAPAPSALAGTWDAELAEQLGALFATEARRKGVDVVLAPLANLQRTPVAGRHFEYFSEDPRLTGTLAAAVVRGLQDRGVGACLKHFVANDSETDRTRYRSRLDERTLREVYLAPFEQVIAEARPWSVMAAYSGVDDGVESAPMTEHARLLRDVLKGEWGFSGPVVSDWAATGSTVESAVGGLDLVMPGPDGPWGEALVAAVRAGEVDEGIIDDKVLRLLRLARATGRIGEPTGPIGEPGQNTAQVLADRPVPGHDRPIPVTPAPEEFALLREIAARGTVLLRDAAGLLPLASDGIGSIALIGPNAVAPYLQGGGSAFVPAVHTVSFEDGLRAALPENVRLSVHRGGDSRRRLPFVSGALLTDPDTGTAGMRADHVDADGNRIGTEVRTSGDWKTYDGFCAGTSRVVLRTVLSLTEPGTHRLQFGCTGRFRVSVDGEHVLSGDDDRGVGLILDSSHHHPPLQEIDLGVGAEARTVAIAIDLTVVDAGSYGRFVTAQLRHAPPGPTPYEEIAEAAAAAQAADVAVVVVGTNEEVESEGWDRTGLELPGHQNELVRKVLAANPRTVVVVNAGAPALLPWADEVPALLWAWLPGQEAGHALADVLLGRTEPSGRLPWTLPARAEDVPVPDARPHDGIVTYTEGLHVGHRAWDRDGLVPAFPFGHGLGWTQWAYASVTACPHSGTGTSDTSVSAASLTSPAGGDGLQLTVELTNTGPRAGHEVVQVYLEPPHDGPDRPARLLAGFTTVQVAAGARATAEIHVPARAFQVWDSEARTWRTPPGSYRLHVGRSSRDLRLTAEVTVDDGGFHAAG
ncbi:beta-glucosidase [Streptomyces jeddahensis]|uniref:Thermostable beta-glucosidase B n=1 Tax=Streptomyces jeddahensis TaxID=1716141 RepID=A0A177HI50_9ACTN|nr:glycoside hydrolase family 3 C-terminal domain-containing protein [Streptomyces jeddahensis]OAH10693.1 thermostable beta-glucosidase B [Streptomyces jeddahensis]